TSCSPCATYRSTPLSIPDALPIFVAKALSPARVREVYLDDDGKEATVVVPDDQLALAIGKEGMNARLAARLTGWKIDIQSDTERSEEHTSELQSRVDLVCRLLLEK